ncbi:MAG: GyrI-like domain-containing protein [Bacteroides sp.]|nr:GyrI-like domain-containing protein [Bacteroides sp.]
MAKITEIMLFQQVEKAALTIKVKTDMKNFGPLIGEGFLKLGTYLEELGEVMTDIPFVEYIDYETMNEDVIRMSIGVYVRKPLPGKGEIQSEAIPERKFVGCLHRGNYNALAELYKEMIAWIKEKGYTPNRNCIEHYYTGPEVPEEEHVTRVIMPLLEP